ncbi:MAG: radical SAM protein [Deltaproteobacteria bacterium]|nr:radical SAM protein [Deltaproteobacteria bacterium]
MKGAEEVIRCLLGRAADGPGGGFVLAGVRPSGGALDLVFDRAGDGFVVRLFPAASDAGFYRRSRHFKLGYAGAEADEDRIALLDAVAAAVSRGEAALGAEACAALFRSAALPGPGPRVRDGALELSLTTRCNESCPFCTTPRRTDVRDPEPEEIERAIRSARGAGAGAVVLTGGEPTLDPLLPRWVALARAEGLRVTVQTNGVLPGVEGWWDRFRDADGAPALPDVLHVSFHTARPGRVRELTGVGGTFDRKVRAVRSARAAGIDVILCFVVTAANADEASEFPSWVAATFGSGVAVERRPDARDATTRSAGPS